MNEWTLILGIIAIGLSCFSIGYNYGAKSVLDRMNK